VSVLFGFTKDMAFTRAVLVVCPVLYLMSFLSVLGLKEVKSSRETSEEEVTKSNSFLSTFRLQLKLLIQFSYADNVYNVTYLANFVSEMGYLLSFVYINAWTS
jgi:hypothetical protein